jgi:signal transduction histidine kinase
VKRLLPWLLALCALCCAAGVRAQVQEPAQALMLVDSALAPPAATRAWQAVPLPDLWRKSRPHEVPAATWYRIDFTHPDDAQPWAVLFPYLYDGGQVWLNGALVSRIAENTSEEHVRWARPHLVTLPPALMRPGANVLMVRAAQPPEGASLRFPRPQVGPEAQLRPLHDRRFFWVSVTAEITAAVCLLVASCVLFIWWRRRSETMYGLFGLAVVLWGIRTLTFVVEVVPMGVYPLWRLAFHGATGGFIVVLTLLAWRLAGIRQPWFERAITAYWLIGPTWLLAQGPAAEPLVNRYWVGGFLPIGATIVAVSAWALVRRRTMESAALPITMALAALAGMHDYMIAWELDPPIAWLAGWTAQRFQLMHLAADLVLLAMGGLLTARFVRALHALEGMNQTLEARVAQREQELAGNYVRLFALEREHATEQERQRIMRELHDGLGSQLFVSLSRVERGDMSSEEIAEALRRCIAEMRLALDTLGPQALDFRSTLGTFLFRWRSQLLACGIRPTWDIDVPDESLAMSPHATLQLLRVAQEALTNVVKHAHATAVDVRLRLDGDLLALEVRDDGLGAAGVCPSSSGRGLTNMRARAEQMGGRCEVHGGSGGTRVSLQVPLAAVRA